MVDEYTFDQVFAWYERIEREVLEFSERVPLTAENETLKAPRLISCLMDSCGLLDSVFRDRIGNDLVIVKGKSKAKKDCTIKDYADLHSTSLDLPNTRSVMLVSPPRYRCPFAPWKSLTQGYVDLPWWQTYNSLKHDLLSNIQKGTLGNVLDALCALHQVLARNPSVSTPRAAGDHAKRMRCWNRMGISGRWGGRGREWPGALLARRTRTIRMCSFDARSRGQPRPLPLVDVWSRGRDGA